MAYFDTSPARRLRTDSSMPKHEAIPSFHGVLDLAASHRPTETPIDDDSDGSEGDDGDGSEASDESDPGGPWATDNPRSTLEDDGSSPYAIVYFPANMHSTTLLKCL